MGSPVNLLVMSPEYVSCNEMPPHVAHDRRLLGRLRRRGSEKREAFHSNNAPSCVYTSVKPKKKKVSMCVNGSK
jgi:hypothetical protein